MLLYTITIDIFLSYTIAMMGYGPEDKNAVLELTYNYGVKEYDKGNAYAQVYFLSFFTFEPCCSVQ